MDILDLSYEEIREKDLDQLREIGIPKRLTRERLSNPDIIEKIELYTVKIAFPVDLSQIKNRNLKREFEAGFADLLKSKDHKTIKQRYGLLVGEIKNRDEIQK